MKHKQSIEEMIKSRRLELRFWQKIEHYFPALFVLIVPLFQVYRLIQYYIFNSYDGSPFVLTEVSILFICASVILAYIQWKKLAFRFYNIQVTHPQLEEALSVTADELEWGIRKKEENFIQATRNGFLLEGFKGDLITIILLEKGVLINCIGDPDKRVSIWSFMHKVNVRTFMINLYNVVNGTNIAKPEEEYNNWSIGNIAFRLIAYPFCLFLIYLGIFHMIPEGNVVLALVVILVSIYYFYTDLSK
ncbi:MAG: hypothetical protein RIM99_00570 [Cyclobacteriaceae bacterium]